MTTTTQNTELRQLLNEVEVIGTLKSHDLQKKVSKAGNTYIGGKVIVQSHFDGKINEIAIKVQVMEKSKLFKGMETVMNEYKAIDTHGAGDADRIRVTGELALNEYYNGQGKLVRFNEVKGVFFNRVEAHENVQDRAVASVETVVENFTPILDADQLPTGDYAVKGFTVAWGNNVVELTKAVIKADLAQAFMNIYQPNSTGRLSFQINNYVEEEETVAQVNTSHGFGSTETVERTIKNFVNNLQIIGGDNPIFGSKEYTLEEIQQAHQVRSLKLAELQQPAASTPPTNNNTAFGTNGYSQETIEDSLPTSMGTDSMPSF